MTAALIASVLTALCSNAEASHAARAEAFRRAAAAVAPSVVRIETVGGTQPTQAGGPAFTVADGPTTGVVFSSDGLILTSSFNFVRDPSVITVVLHDDTRHVAELLARDELRRLAMLKIEAKDLPTPSWTERIRVGQWAVSLGRGHGRTINGGVAGDPAGGCTITAGIVSGLNRMSGLVLQTDAKLSPANFGGPLVDLDGKVVGLCVPIGMDTSELSGVEWYDSGIGFAVPIEQVRTAADELAGGHNIRRGILGVAIHPAMPDAVVIAGVGDPSPAMRAGLRGGDTITAIDGEPVKNHADLRRVLRPRSAGARVIVRIRREGDKAELPVTLAVPEDVGPVPRPVPELPLPLTKPAESWPPTPRPKDDGTPLPPPPSGPS